MLKKYLSKFAMDILPSVAATIIGAYIVNHYIVSKPGSDAPVAAAVSTVVAPAPAKPEVKASAKAVDLANVREPGVTAKGISERAILEKTAAEKPAGDVKETPTETASIPADTRRHQPSPREKSVVRTAPAPASAVSAPNPATAAEAVSAPQERRDANELARAAIERLRGTGDGSRAHDAPRVAEPSRVPDAPRVVMAPAVRPLPPPVMVSTPAGEAFDSQDGSSPRPPYAGLTGNDDAVRPTPPADIPLRPLDLMRSEAAESPVRERASVAQEMLMAAKSVFHAVLPK